MPDLSSYNLMDAKEKLEAESLAGVYDVQDANDPGYNLQWQKSIIVN